jgi:hypothetical protein
MTYQASLSGLELIQKARQKKGWTITENFEILVAASLCFLEDFQKEKGYSDQAIQWKEELKNIFTLTKNSPETYKAEFNNLQKKFLKLTQHSLSHKEMIKIFIEENHFYLKGISYQTWKRFNQGKPVNKPAFKAYCAILGLDWQEVVHSEFEMIDLKEAPEIKAFYGRIEELKQLEQWIVTDNCRLVGIIAMGGMGKTALSVKMIETIKRHFKVIIWRTLKNKIPFREMLEDWLKIISNQENVTEISNIHQGIEQLMSYLKKTKCLLILDNLESILQPQKESIEYQEV